MNLITHRSIIQSVPDRWSKQYPTGLYDNKQYPSIEQKLRKLDLNTATPKDVEAIIGNDSWTRHKECSECQREISPIVQLGEDDEYSSRRALVCESCLRRAIGLFHDADHEVCNG